MKMLKVEENKAKTVDNAVTISLVSPQLTPSVWGQVEKWLNKGEKHFRGYYKNEHLYNAIMSGQMQLWISFRQNKVRTIMLTQLDFYPEGLQFRFVYIGGEVGSFKEIVHAFRMVEIWAIDHGARKACIIGRDGWLKKLAKFGYHKKSIMLVKDLYTLSNSNGHAAWKQ